MRTLNGKTPDIAAAAFVAETAVLIGEVSLAAGSSVWYGAVLRGDSGPLIVGENTNIQDNAVLHCDRGGRVVLGSGVTVGHGAIVHGCTVGDNTIVGMHATILNHAVVGQDCIIGAGALVTEDMHIPDGSLVVGVPARVLRPVSDEQWGWMRKNAASYREEAEHYAAQMPGISE